MLLSNGLKSIKSSETTMVHFAGKDGIHDGAPSKTFLTKLHLQFSMVVYQKTRCCMYRMEILELVGKFLSLA